MNIPLSEHNTPYWVTPKYTRNVQESLAKFHGSSSMMFTLIRVCKLPDQNFQSGEKVLALAQHLLFHSAPEARL